MIQKKSKFIVAFRLPVVVSLAILLAAQIPLLLSHAQSEVGRVVASGQGVARITTIRPQGPVYIPRLQSQPGPQAEPEENDKEHSPINTPIDPSVRPEDIRPTNAESDVQIIPELLSGASVRNDPVPAAPGTFTLYRNDTTGDRPAVPGPTPPSSFSPYEPSVGVNGRVVFYSTNNFVAYSGDRGQTFSYLNPFANFSGGSIDNVNGGFGGDQYIYYSRTHGAMFWLLQYNPDNTTNTQRLAVARSQQDVLNNRWIFYDFTPAYFGFTTPATGTNGFWLDFPDMATSDNFLYLTTNVFPRTRRATPTSCTATCPTSTCPAGCASCTAVSCSSIGAVITRIPLSELAAGATIHPAIFNDTRSSYRLTQGATDTMYWGSHNSNTQIRIYRWPENGNIAWDDVTHDAYNAPGRGMHTATCAGGTNYLSNDDDRIQGAWVANGVIGFMWDAAQGNGFARPHVQVVRFNESNRTRIGQGQIFSSTTSFSYPSVHPNDRGHLGGTISFGCGGSSGNPGLAAWIADDINNNVITPLESFGVAFGNRSEARWGDYCATRRHSPNGNTWVGTGFVLNANSVRDHRVVWFGRERDTPPATSPIFVSRFNTTSYEDGSLFHPYKTITNGNFAAMPGDVISIVSGNYNERGVFNRRSTLQRLGTTGTVVIGVP